MMVTFLMLQVLKRQVNLLEEIDSIVKEILSTSGTLFSLYASGMSVEETKKELEVFVPRIHSFLQTYLYPNRYINFLIEC